MAEEQADTDELLRRSGQGDGQARLELLARQRPRLRQMIAVRLDRRLLARLDPSDVVQEVLMEAHQRLDDYLRRQPLPFFPWLRQIASQRLIKLHEHHHARKRQVTREQRHGFDLPDESWAALAERLVHSATSPSKHLLRQEQRRRVRQALDRLGERDLEVLVLRYLEGLSPGEIAEVLAISEGAVKTRHTRALIRLQALLADEDEQP